MPNHCENDLYIRGRASEVANMLEAIKSEETQFDFATLIPYPKQFEDMDKEYRAISPYGFAAPHAQPALTDIDRKRLEAAYLKKWNQTGPYPKDGYNSGGYDWCIKNWGTKWNAYEIEIFRNKNGSAKIKFHTAWSPPVPIIIALGKKFPSLKLLLRYFEGGAAYQGELRIIEGDVQVDASKEYRGRRGG